VTRYNGTKKPKTTTKKELKKNNKIAMDFILQGLYDLVKDKVGKCSSTRELWDKLHNIYSSSPIIESKIAKEDTNTKQEERCSSRQTYSKEEECEELEVDYKEEFMSAIKVIKMEKEKNNSLRVELKEKEKSQNYNSKEVEQTIIILKGKLEEAKRIEETLEDQKQCLEAKIVA
jgi:hypothetical protein